MTGDNSVAYATIILAGTLAGGFFTLINKQNKTHEKIAVAMTAVAKASQNVATKTEKVANATIQGNKEAKERNGHLAELVLQTSEKTVEAIQTIKKQEIGEQHVKTQTIEEVKS